jgi:RHS repeat-associated protein
MKHGMVSRQRGRIWQATGVLVAVVVGMTIWAGLRHPPGRTMNQPSDTIVAPDTDENGRLSGSLLGTSEVTAEGAAVYTIPLWVSPGRNGMQPELALTYNSRGPNGLLGVGWTIAGLPQIERCHVSYAIDVRAAAIAFDASDPFCLDGQRLRLVSGTNGALQATYKTERDSFAKIVIDAADRQGPTRFSVFLKNGRIMRFGGQSGYIRSANRPDTVAPAAWLLAQVEDRFGNAMVYSYDVSSFGVYPTEIAYTSSLLNSQLKATRRIGFVYETRSDIEFSASVGLQDLTQRLSRIEVFGPDTSSIFSRVRTALPIRTYTLAYSIASITGRSLLSSVTASDAEGHKLSPTTFQWQLGKTGFTTIQTDISDAYSDSDGRYRGFRLLDLDGDGLVDLLYLRNAPPNHPDWWGDAPEYVVRLSTGQGFAAPIGMLEPARLSAWNEYRPPEPMLYSASESPGLLLWATHDAAKPSEYGSPAVQQILNSPGLTNVPRFGAQYFPNVVFQGETVIPMDMDGDGLADLAAGWFEAADSGATIAHWQFLRNLGQHNFAAPTEIVFPPQLGEFVAVGLTMPMRGVQADGSGRQELIACQANGPATLATVLTSYDSYQTDLITCSDKLTEQKSPLFFDANGDGLDDVVMPTDPTSPAPNKPPSIGMTTVLNMGRNFPSVHTWIKDHELIAGIRVIDYDIDGHYDLLATRALDWNYATKKGDDVKGIRIFRSATTAAGIQLTQVFPVSKSNDKGLPLTNLSDAELELLEVGDINGDGLQDIVTLQKGRFVIYLRNGYKPDMMVGVVDGVGAETGFLYAPLSNKTVYGTSSNPITYPQRAVSGGLLVVSEHQVSNATGIGFSTNVYDHHYEDAIEDIRGRGFLGFRAHEIVDQGHGRRTRTEYDLSADDHQQSLYAFAGLPRKETTIFATTSPGSPCGGVVRQLVTNHNYISNLHLRSGVYAPFEKATDVTVSDCVNAQMKPAFQEGTQRSVDEYGNVTSLTTTFGNGDQYVSNDTYDNSESDWLVNRKIRSVETSTVKGDSVRRTTAFRYDAVGSLQRVVIEPGDDSGPVISPLPQPQSDGVSSLFVRYDRDSNGQVNQVSYDLDSSPTANERATRIFFDDPDEMFPTRIVNGLGHTTQLSFDPGLGVQATKTDPNGVHSRWQYDTFGRIKLSEPGGDDSLALTYGGWAGWSADPAKYPLEIVGVGGSGWKTRIRVDALGREVSSTMYDRADGEGVEISRIYDEIGQLSRTVSPHFEGTTTSAATQVKYDPAGRPTYIKLEGGNVFECVYRGNQKDCHDGAASDPTSIRTTVSTDLSGQIISSVQHARAESGSPARDLTMTYELGPFGVVRHVRSEVHVNGVAQIDMEHDRLGRITSIKDLSRGLRSYQYDAFGEILSEAVSFGDTEVDTRRYQYDVLGRFRLITTRDGETKFEWDSAATGLGKLASLTSPQNIVMTFGYDSLSRLSNKTWQIGTEKLTIGRDYDSFGRLERLRYPDLSGKQFAVRYQYSMHGSLSAIIDDSSHLAYLTSLETDEMGLAINPSGLFPRIKLGNGTVTRWIESPTNPGELGAIRTTLSNSKPIQSLNYAYDNKLNLKVRRDNIAGITEGFDYDGLNRLRLWTIPEFSIVSYGYDDEGNLLHRNQEFGTGESASFSYAKANGAGLFAVSAMDSSAYFYGDGGNQIAGPGRQLKFTPLGLPLHADAAGTSYDFGYDGFGSRIYRRSASLEITSLENLYERRSNGAGQQIFTVMGPTGPVCQVLRSTSGVTPDSVLYIHPDNLGSTESVTDASGKIVQRRQYDPFGRLIGFSLAGVNYVDGKKKKNVGNCVSGDCLTYYQKKLAQNAAVGPTVGFAAHRDDPELNLINFVGRMYDPISGRFLTPDPYVDSAFNAGGLNSYAYSSNNPLTYVDRNGFDWEWPGNGSDSGFSWQPIDPLPPGPWAQGTNLLGHQPAPTTGRTSSGTAGAPYNPVDEVGNREAAARISYQPRSTSADSPSRLKFGADVSSIVGSLGLQLDPAVMGSSLAVIYAPPKAWPTPWERDDLTGAALDQYAEKYFNRLDDAYTYFSGRSLNRSHASFEASRLQLGLPEASSNPPADRFMKELDLINDVGPIGLLFMAVSDAGSFYGQGDIATALDRLVLAKPFDRILGGLFSYSTTADFNQKELRAVGVEPEFLYATKRKGAHFKKKY